MSTLPQDEVTGQGNPCDPIPTELRDSFHPDHWVDLQHSGLSPETIQALGIHSARPGDIPKLIGWMPAGVMSVLAFPYPGEGEKGFSRLKVFPPFTNGAGHTVKYLQRKRSGVRLYLPPLAQSVMKDPTVPFAWTEGEKKAARACQDGLPCGALGGLWNWLEENLPIAKLDEIAHADRLETIYPDSDVWARPDLLKAVYAFGRELGARGARVQVGILPPRAEGTKCGLDDFLQERGCKALEAIDYLPLKHKTFTGFASWWQGWRRSSLHTSRRKGKGPKAASAPLAANPYRVQGGRLVHLVEKMMFGEPTVEVVPISDFEARIIEESIAEDGTRAFGLEGKTVRGALFSLELAAGDFADERLLRGALTQASGAQSPVRAGMAKHLGPAIQLLTKSDDLRQVRRYERTGWADGRFLLPGRDLPNIRIVLSSKLPYGAHRKADLALGLEALNALFEAMTPSRSTVAATIAFEAPLANLVGWRDERYALFLSGRTGTFKTSWVQVLMSLYGEGFLQDSLLLKWGDGATTNAIMAYAAQAHDLPFLIDNFKPSTGGGPRDFVNLIHNILEGGEKERLTRAATLRETKPVFCWPVVTGEDVPDHDPASLARILVVRSSCEPGAENASLTKAQEFAPHLSAVGLAWLTWLEGEEAKELSQDMREMFPSYRATWAERLRKTRPDMVNVFRVASNLATGELTWRVLTYHPTIGALATHYKQAHLEGLYEVASTMASATAESLEASRYLAVLRELLASQRYILLPKGEAPTNESERDRMLGWKDDDGSVYLLPKLARDAVSRTLGKDGLAISDQTLHAQLQALGAIQTTNPGRETKRLKCEGKAIWTLHLRKESLVGPEELDT